MAKRKPSNDGGGSSKPPKRRPRKPVEIDEDIVGWIGSIVSLEGGTVPKWVSDTLRPIAKAEFLAVTERAKQRLNEMKETVQDMDAWLDERSGNSKK